jgi:hypothetical protein
MGIKSQAIGLSMLGYAGYASPAYTNPIYSPTHSQRVKNKKNKRKYGKK